MPTYHLDFAGYALNLLGFDQEERSGIKDLIESRLATDSRRHDEVKIVISDIALAETITKVYDSLNTQGRITGFSDYLYKLYKILSRLNPNYLPVKHEAIKVYNFLAEDGFLLEKLGPHDLLILSQAIADKDSDYLFTIDNSLLTNFYNKTVHDALENFHSENKLRIGSIKIESEPR
jgi:hypothetical protein